MIRLFWCLQEVVIVIVERPSSRVCWEVYNVQVSGLEVLKFKEVGTIELEL